MINSDNQCITHLDFETELKQNGYHQILLKGDALLWHALNRSLNDKHGKEFSMDFKSYLIFKDNSNKLLCGYTHLVDLIESVCHTEVAKSIISNMNRNILSLSHQYAMKEHIEELISALNKNDFLSKIREIQNPRNIVLFFSDEAKQKQILDEFFDPAYTNNAVMGLFSHQLNNEPGVKTILYSEIENENKLDQESILNFFGSVHKQNNNETTKFACSDTMWFTKKGYSQEHEQVVRKLDPSIVNNSTILCCYSLQFITREHFIKILESKPIVITDSFTIYDNDSCEF